MKYVMLVPVLALGLMTSAFAQGAGASGESTQAVVAKATAAAEGLLASLDESQREAVLFAFDDREQRLRWSNLPVGIYERKGLRWGDLSEPQRQAVFALFNATLSPAGVQQIVENMEGDQVLENARQPRGRVVFGRDEYFFSILGKPSTTQPWMWQFGGHHLGINATIVGDQITLAPSLTGGQPVDYVLDGKKVRQLASEEDKSFALIGSFTDEQLKAAVLDDHHADMTFGPGHEGVKPKQEGINASKLTEEQRALLLELIGERIGLLNETHAGIRMRQIEKDLDATWFAWFGPTTPGSASSFCIQGPTIMMEYSPQHLGGDATAHTHAMYRDPTNDYGVGFIEGEEK